MVNFKAIGKWSSISLPAPLALCRGLAPFFLAMGVAKTFSLIEYLVFRNTLFRHRASTSLVFCVSHLLTLFSLFLFIYTTLRR